MLVLGLVGGALGGLPTVALTLDAERAIGGALLRFSMDTAWDSLCPGGSRVRGGALNPLEGGGGVPEGGGGVPLLTDRGPALGGGGVADFASTFSAPGFLLIHLFSSGS